MYTSSAGLTCTACPADSTVLVSNTGCQCNSGCSGTWPSTCSSCDYTAVAPTLVSAEAVSSTGLNVTWQTNQGSLFGPKKTTGYEVQCDEGTSSTCTGVRRGTVASLITALSTALQSSVVSGLTAATEYKCYVVAFNTLYDSTGTCSGSTTATTNA
jgi:hypothetical protein